MTFPSPGADWPKIDAYLKGLGIRIDAPTFGETEGGNHVAGSEHYQHRARDYPTSSCDAPAVARALQPLAHGPGYVIDELFFSPLGIWYDSGTAYVPSASAIERVNHYNHCHAGCIRGAVFPATSHLPPTPRGFLMALTDAQQGDVYNMLTDLKNKAQFGGGAHPNYGDLVNEVVKQVNAHVDTKIAEAIAALKP